MNEVGLYGAASRRLTSDGIAESAIACRGKAIRWAAIQDIDCDPLS